MGLNILEVVANPLLDLIGEQWLVEGSRLTTFQPLPVVYRKQHAVAVCCVWDCAWPKHQQHNVQVIFN